MELVQRFAWRQAWISIAFLQLRPSAMAAIVFVGFSGSGGVSSGGSGGDFLEA